jgi:hypothetical protein
MLSKEEMKVLDRLVMAWNEFNDLKVLHPLDSSEFLKAIHAAQNIILARPSLRELQEAGIVARMEDLHDGLERGE